MGLPTLQFLGSSAVGGFLINHYLPQYAPGTILTAFLLFFLQTFSYTTWSAVLYPRFFSPLRDLPTPAGGNLFFGQTGQIRREPSGMPMRQWAETVPNDGLIRYSAWFQQRLLPTSPKVLSELLVTKNYDFEKPARLRRDIGNILGIGILLAEGEEHKTQKKNLLPAFKTRHILDLYPVFWNKAREMVDTLAATLKEEQANKEKDNDASQQHSGAIDVGNWVSRATLDIIGLAGMGQDFNALQDADNELCKHYRNVFSPSKSAAVLQLMSQILPVWLVQNLPVKRNNNIGAAADAIKQTCRDSITKKRQVMAGNEKGSSDIDILSVALESGGFTDEGLANQMMTFLAAGHETTATAMTWALYALCKHPSIQQKLRDEVRSKLPPLDENVTPAQLDDCHYLHAFCSEVLRVYAPVAMTFRTTAKDTSLNGHFVPKDTLIVLSPWAINTDTHLWGADAHDFKPERWLEDGRANKKGSADSNFSFLTFLHGPRACIGQKFAEAEFALLLAAWVGSFETKLEAGSPHAGDDLKVKGGIPKPFPRLTCEVKELPGW